MSQFYPERIKIIEFLEFLEFDIFVDISTLYSILAKSVEGNTVFVFQLIFCHNDDGSGGEEDRQRRPSVTLSRDT